MLNIQEYAKSTGKTLSFTPIYIHVVPHISQLRITRRHLRGRVLRTAYLLFRFRQSPRKLGGLVNLTQPFLSNPFVVSLSSRRGACFGT